MFNKNRGFTLIELILVLAVLAILAVAAMPKIFSLTNEAELASRDGLVGSVRAAIGIYGAQATVLGTRQYPLSLDNGMPPGSPCTAGAGCFNVIMKDWYPDDEDWQKTNWNSYQHIPSGVIYDYNNLTGSFAQH